MKKKKLDPSYAFRQGVLDMLNEWASQGRILVWDQENKILVEATHITSNGECLQINMPYGGDEDE